MYTYRDKGGAVAAVALDYYVEVGYDFWRQLPQELEKVLPTLCCTAEPPPHPHPHLPCC